MVARPQLLAHLDECLTRKLEKYIQGFYGDLSYIMDCLVEEAPDPPELGVQTCCQAAFLPSQLLSNSVWLKARSTTMPTISTTS